MTQLRTFNKRNMTEITTGNKRVFFSYRTPVVVLAGSQYYVTNKKFSKTTTSHIRDYLQEQTLNGPYKAFNVKYVTQEELEKIANEN